MIWFLGDTHGSFRHVVEHVLEAKRDDRLPHAIIFLGDQDCARPLHVELDEIAGLTEIFWIPGNHDSDDNLHGTTLSPANQAKPTFIAGLPMWPASVLPASAVFSGSAFGPRRILRIPEL